MEIEDLPLRVLFRLLPLALLLCLDRREVFFARVLGVSGPAVATLESLRLAVRLPLRASFAVTRAAGVLLPTASDGETCKPRRRATDLVTRISLCFTGRCSGVV